ncbi:TPA: integrating conjugative element protein [Klebsiella oxytoca]|nr:integrating conjugative element protein [Klebsiella oxytoca]
MLLPFMATPAQAGLHILADYGGEPTAPFYEGLNRDAPPVAPASEPAPTPLLATGFPVRTPELTPGEVPRRAFQAPGITPLFLVGDDERSREWLRRNAVGLSALRATGIVVNVESPQRLATLQALTPGTVLVPSSGSDIAGRLQLTHYPVLVTASGLSGQLPQALEK